MKYLTAIAVNFVRIENKSKTGLKADSKWEKGIGVRGNSGLIESVIDFDGNYISVMKIYDFYPDAESGSFTLRDDTSIESR